MVGPHFPQAQWDATWDGFVEKCLALDFTKGDDVNKAWTLFNTALQEEGGPSHGIQQRPGKELVFQTMPVHDLFKRRALQRSQQASGWTKLRRVAMEMDTLLGQRKIWRHKEPGRFEDELVQGMLDFEATMVKEILVCLRLLVSATHKVLEEEVPEMQARIRKDGWEIGISPATRTPAGGVSAGTAIAWKPHLDVAAPMVHIWPGRLSMITMRFARIGEVDILAMYGPVGDTATLRNVFQAAHSALTNRPFIIGGDFNASRQEVNDILFDLHLDWQTHVPADPTCFTAGMPSCIDFFVTGGVVTECMTKPVVVQAVEVPTHKPVEVATR